MKGFLHHPEQTQPSLHVVVAVQGAAEALAPVGLAPASENRENFTAWKALLRVVLSFCDARVSGGDGGRTSGGRQRRNCAGRGDAAGKLACCLYL